MSYETELIFKYFEKDHEIEILSNIMVRHHKRIKIYIPVISYYDCACFSYDKICIIFLVAMAFDGADLSHMYHDA